MTRLAVSAFLLLAVLLPRHAAAQWRLHPDQRVRVVVSDGGQPYRTAATVLEVGADSVLLDIRGTQRSVALSALSRVEISRGGGARAKWAVIGALAGTALGYGYTLYDRSNTRGTERVRNHLCPPTGECSFPDEERTLPYSSSRTLTITAGGTLVGALAGLLLPGDRWEPLPGRASAARAAALPPPPAAR